MATQYTAGLTTGQVLTAATMNSIGAAWESYTPVIKGGATTVTATIQYAKYVQINKLVIVQMRATVTSAGAVNGSINVSLPTGLDVVTPSNQRAIGTVVIEDTGSAFYVGMAVATQANLIRFFSYNVPDFMGSAGPAMTLANNDVIGFSICYEVA
jgi:hypothetical protein